MIPTIVMRARNDMPLIAETLAALSQQTLPFHLVAFDNASTDGTREEFEKYTSHIVTVPAGEYVPGRVLNDAFRVTQSEIVVFLNSDCTPTNPYWLANLLSSFSDPKVVATFGRQVPREDCWSLYARDTEATYGDGSLQARWRNCFSMASCAVRRSVWEQFPFNEALQYSEDIDWSYGVRQAGHTIQYAPKAAVRHSHNYTWKQFYRRHFGEGKAEARIFQWSLWQGSLIRYSLLPFVKQTLHDLHYCAKRADWVGMYRSPYLRIAQLLGRRAGFVNGLREGKA